MNYPEIRLCELRQSVTLDRRAERDPQCPVAWSMDAAARPAEALQEMVNVAHHPEVAILDERRAHDTQRIPGIRAWRGCRRQTTRDIRIFESSMLTPRD